MGSSFAGLTTARYLHQYAGDAIELTVIDLNPYLVFVPNISMEAFDGRDPLVTMHLGTVSFYDRDGTEFIGAEVTNIDPDSRTFRFVPNDRMGSAAEFIHYDYLVIALGNRLAYDKIEGFGEFCDSVSSGHYGNKLRRKLRDYRGGPIAIGSARFNQGLEGKPDWLL